MQFPLLRLVTPASTNESVNAFTDELKNLGWVWQGGNKNLDFDPAGTTAQQAVTDVINALKLIPIKPAVIVTAGLAATTAVSQATGGNAVPAIVQAAGGGLPNPIPNNVTGFVLNPSDRPYGTSNDQLQRLVGMSLNAMYIAVLYDSTNGVSTTGAFAALQALAPTLDPPPNIVPLDVNGGNLQQFFKVQKLLNNPNPCTGFMLLPNAQFYDKQARHYIAKTVVEDPQSPVQFAIYPEREYKKEHSNRLNKFVHGHYIRITFRRAALYVDSLLDGTAVIASLPAQEALTDED